ncbi:MAG: CopG family antitoxin [Clostridiales bacterium]|nr:CopG family antitoxin [Clostridiales bacterium]
MNNKKRKMKLDPEEREILEVFHKGELRSDIKNRNELKPIIKAAVKTSRKSRNINIRLTERDLEKIKQRAEETGVPYQTLIGAILHQYAEGKITPRM